MIGKYNGMKIDGFTIKFDVRFSYFNLYPVIKWKYINYFSWGFFSIRIDAIYK